MAGVALHGFNVTAAGFEFVGCAGVPETVKDHLGKIVQEISLLKARLIKFASVGVPWVLANARS